MEKRLLYHRKKRIKITHIPSSGITFFSSTSKADIDLAFLPWKRLNNEALFFECLPKSSADEVDEVREMCTSFNDKDDARFEYNEMRSLSERERGESQSDAVSDS